MIAISYVNVDSFNIESGYSCSNYSFLLQENSAEIFDGLLELESSVPEDIKMVLVYIAGYITSTLESRIIGGVGIIGGLDIVIIINNRGFDGVEKIVQAVS